MLILRRLLTFGPCFVFFWLLLVFICFVGCVLLGAGGSVGIGLILLASTGLSIAGAALLTFGGVFPWCRANGNTPSFWFRWACTVVAALIPAIALWLFLSITILDKSPRPIQLAKIGMTKSLVIKLIGPPDWREPGMLWAYRVRGDGIGGILVPYYFTFDGKGLLVSVHS